MNRYAVLGIGLGLLSVVGCNREQVADMALTMAFNPGFHTAASSAEPAAPTATSTDSAAVVPSNSAWEDLVQDLESFRQLEDKPTAEEGTTESWETLIHRLATPASDSATSALLSARQEAHLVALRSAAERFPDRFSDSLENLGEHAGDSGNQAANVSAMRILNGYLVTGALPQETSAVLSVHTLTYPDCPMNVELHRLLAERLANENRLSEAVTVARVGAKRCQKFLDVRPLEKQVASLVARNPAAQGFPFQLAGRTVRNKPFDVASLRGKVVVVTFWATWCPGCRAESVHLRNFADTYRKDGVEFVGVSLDENREELTRFLQDESIDWPQLFVSSKTGERVINPFAKYYGVREIPFTIVVDREGLIVASGLRGESQIETVILDQITSSTSNKP